MKKLIIAIIASIAYPSYQESVRKSRRSDAFSSLSRMADLQERFYLQKFVPTNVYDPELAEKEQYTQDELYEIVQELKGHVPDCRIR